MMTRKDYVSVADILNLFRDDVDKQFMIDLVNEFSDFFQEDNPRFNPKRFHEAVFAE
jgi:hypothetical protein